MSTDSPDRFPLVPPVESLHYEDLKPGGSYTTASRTITEADVVLFAGLTGDYNRMHTDARYAESTAFGQRIAHGLLIASVSAGLNSRTVENQSMERQLLGLLETRLSFPKPTFFGDTIGVIVQVVERRETSRSDRGIVVFKRDTVNQRNETVVSAQVTLLVRRREELKRENVIGGPRSD